MTLLVPLGLLGLIGIVVLILIYILRPNYQQKNISSTYVWRLSLKYRKKNPPISKLRNILMFLSQVFILTACALLLARPMLVKDIRVAEREAVVVIDASASMRTQTDGTTRFERAVTEAWTLADEVFEKDGYFSVVLGGETAELAVERATAANRATVDALFESWLEEDVCTYGTTNIAAAFDLCEGILQQNAETEVYLCTDVTYSYVPDDVHVIDVTEETEWNAAILNAYTELEQNNYIFYVEIAAYGKDVELVLNLQINGVNKTDKNDKSNTVVTLSTADLEEPLSCSRDKTQTIVFINEDIYEESYSGNAKADNVYYYPIPQTQWIYSYESAHIWLDVSDSFGEDDSYDLYGGLKEPLKIQYASSLPNGFFAAVFDALGKLFAKEWNFQITEVRMDASPATEGYDLYVYEHTMPETLPTDGVVWMIDPDIESSNARFLVDTVYSFSPNSMPLAKEIDHEILQNVEAGNITIMEYTRLILDEEYQTLLSCDGYPILSVLESDEQRLAVLAFSVHYSELVILPEFPLLIYNMLYYFLPGMVSEYAYEVNESIFLNAVGEIHVEGYGVDEILSEFPTAYSVATPGTYTLTQQIGKRTITESVYVAIPSAESNIWATGDVLDSPYRESVDTMQYSDLVLYIAAALVALLFVEWWLQSRVYM